MNISFSRLAVISGGLALAAISMAASAAGTRTIEVVMDDTMRFTPSSIAARPGETLRIVARNAGKLDHELVIGDETAIREHARAMQHGGDHAHATGAAVRVKPGQSGEVVVTYSRPTTLQMACLVPGHYEAGMRGTLTIGSPAGTSAPASGSHRHAH